MYNKPTISKIGGYRALTNGAGSAREKDYTEIVETLIEMKVLEVEK